MRSTPESRERFEELARDHMSSLYGKALRLTRRAEDAEDLVQDTLLRAYRFQEQYQPGTNFKAWTFRILTNTFINRYHRSRRGPALVRLGALDGRLEREPDPALPWGAARIKGPEQTLLDGLLDRKIEEALEDLPPGFRVVLTMAVLEHMSYKEIAAALSIPIGTVMSRLHRARRFLQARLRGYAARRGFVAPTKPLDGARIYPRRMWAGGSEVKDRSADRRGARCSRRVPVAERGAA